MKNSVVAYRDGDRFASVTYKSANVKTGDMAQLTILARGADPVTASQNGLDANVCGDCIFRTIPGVRKRMCYVNLAHAPLAIYRAVSRAPVTGIAKIIKRLGSKAIRLVAYGDPAFLPVSLLSALTKGRKWTGYTHQWRTVSKAYRRFLMASVESTQDRAEAKKKGYRTFRVVSHINEIEQGEVLCPNYSKGVQCADCGLCNGAGQAKDITILAHGGTGNADKFTQIGQA